MLKIKKEEKVRERKKERKRDPQQGITQKIG